MAFKSRSNADHTRLISKSIFITNFPDVTTSKDLWVLCQSYGTVVDVFIPNRMSKAGKRFAFVRFIKVDNVERLVGNLCTLWIGRKHLQANVARFDRDSIPSKRVPHKFNHVAPTPTSFVSAVKGVSSPPIPLASSPALVLDDSCMVARDLDNFVMGEVRQFSSINNLSVLLHNEGFMNIEIVYLGGLWVMIKLGSAKTKLKFMKHTGVASWFVRLCNAQNDFVASDRIVWVDIEGVPLHAWSHATFHKIGSQWGEVMELEDGNEDLFARKRLCIKTKHANNILDSFKIIVKGKVFQIRAKELFVWSPSFKEVPEVVHCSDDESVKNEADINVVDNTVNNEGEESDSEAVSDTFFGDNGDAQEHDNEVDQTLNDKEVSKDPFNIYDLLNRHKKEVGNSGMESSIPYPPGFTPEKVNVTFEQEAQEVQGEECIRSHHNSDRCSSRVFEEVEKSDINIQSDGRVIRDIRKEGGSILDILDEMIKVGQTMGFTMDGCTKDMEKIIGSNGETKKESFSDLEVKYFWGNYQFDHIVSEALGYSGGILCVWDSNVFHKKHHIISDNFVALYGTWIPRKIQLLIISVYAPQSYASKCQLWDFIASLINQWNGECMVMGDFNEVRCKEDRWGSTFLAQGACSFNSFISNAGLNEVQLEGYSFTWAHPSASKMSKLDRFFVTDGFLSLFPHISAVCLDRHLSDHRPILLREMLVDFGATPFRLYHSWLSIPGFDQMITSTWNSFILVDSNGMIRFKKKLQLLKKEIRKWVAEYKNIQSNSIRDVKNKLSDIDKLLDQGGVTDDVLLSRMEAMKQLQELNSSVNCDFVQKAKVRWAIEGDENSKFFHGIINRKRANLSVKGIMIEGEWVDDPIRVKDEFRNHFADRFNDPGTRHGRINFSFPNRLTFEQVSDLEASVSDEEIRKAVWGCGENKSPGPDGFTFEFFRKFWTVVGPDFCIAVKWFFEHGFFATGCNSSFVTLIPKTLDPKLVTYDSIRWDYLDDVLNAFGFGSRWRSWIQGSLNSGKASVLVNGSPTSEFQFHRGLKQGDPLAPFLFILIMESLHLSFNRAVEAGSRINLKKSHILGLGIRGSIVSEAAASLGCSVMKTPFNYLGIMIFIMRILQPWNSIIKEFNYLKVQGVDVFSHCKIRIGNGLHTRFWKDLWIGDCTLSGLFLVRGGIEEQQLEHLVALLDSVILSNSNDRWVSDLNGDGVFRVKEIPLTDIIQATSNFVERNIIDRYYGCKVYKGELSRKKFAFVLIDEGYTTNFYRLATHPNIVPFTGCCDEDGKAILVLEHPTRGGLDKYYLQNNPRTNEMKNEDLNSASIHLDENWQAKIQLITPSALIRRINDPPSISEFRRRGSSMYYEDQLDDVDISLVREGRLGYLYSSYLETGRLSEIYSFGVMLFELLCSRLAVTYDEDGGARFLSKLACSHYEEGTLTEIHYKKKVEQVTQFSRATFVARETPLNDKSPSDVADRLFSQSLNIFSRARCRPG
ncbi:RNA-directed DNA polymerase, eukaryota [Tanacetum coccineum]